jgi:sphingosine-1-phosphate phosphatase 1
MRRIQSDTELIKRIQRYRSPFLDSFMRFASLLGDEPAFTYGLPVLGWSIGPEAGLLVILSWAATFYLGHALKDYLMLPRPFTIDRDVACLEHSFSAEFGMPSTHAQAVWAIPPTVLLSLHQQLPHLVWWILFAVCYASLVSFSRLYLGVHSLLDVAAGAMLGVATCVVVLLFGPSLRLLYLDASPSLALLAVLLVHVALLLLYPALPGVSTTYRDTCSILGVSLGVWWAARTNSLFLAHLSLAGTDTVSLSVYVGRVAVGLIVVAAGHFVSRLLVKNLFKTIWPFRGNKRDLEHHMPFVAAVKFVSYIGIGFNSLGLVPLFFYWMGLY